MTSPAHLVVLLGAGGHAAEVAGYLDDLRAAGLDVRLAGCVDEVTPPGVVDGLPVIGGFDRLAELVAADPQAGWRYHAAVGDNDLRRRLVEKVGQVAGGVMTPFTVIHPMAYAAAGAEIGPGCCLAPGAVVTSRARVGVHTICNVNSSVSHDVVVGEYVALGPGAALCGRSRVGTGCTLGPGATIGQRVQVGERTTVGAGAVVIRDLPADVTAVGVPARVIRTHPRPAG